MKLTWRDPSKYNNNNTTSSLNRKKYVVQTVEAGYNFIDFNNTKSGEVVKVERKNVLSK